MKTEITAKQVFLYLIRAIRPFPLGIGVMVATAFFWAADLSLRPYFLKIIINRLSDGVGPHTFEYLAFPMLGYTLMFIGLVIIFRVYGYCVEIQMIPRLRQKIANEALGRLVSKSHAYFQNNYSGSLTNKVNDLTGSIPDLIQIIIDRFFSHALAFSVAIFTLWQVNIRFALFMVFFAVMFISGALLFSKRLACLADDWSEFGSTITGKIVDVLSNIVSVHLFAAQSQEKRSCSETFDGAVRAEQKLQWAYFWMWCSNAVSCLILQVFNFYFILKGRQEGWITVGDVALVMAINISIMDFMWGLSKDFSQFSKLFGRVTQALRAILDETEIRDSPSAQNLVVATGRIVFDQVQFNYKGTPALFQNKSISIEPGQKVGLVGYSGGGKSTFVNLILRLFDVTAGRILIDGQNIQEVTQDSLHLAIGMIPQDPSLFHRSLLDNIRYGCKGATLEQVIEAAKKAHAHEFITKVPQGYEALVGERGIKLSGGQRQRIAIARAILKNAPILILDEATSQLDSITESGIQDSLWELMQGKTTIVVAHRLSTLLHMDRILVFDQGKIVEDGTHQELVMQHGLYQTLWDAQVGGFLPDKKEGTE